MPTDVKVKISALDSVTDASPLSATDSEVSLYIRDAGQPVATRDRTITRDRMRLEMGGVQAVEVLPSDGRNGQWVILLNGDVEWGPYDDDMPSGEATFIGASYLSSALYAFGPTTNKIYRGPPWVEFSSIPAVATDVQGIAHSPSGDIVVLDAATKKYYTKTHGTSVWDSGVATPSEETNPTGIDIDQHGDVAVVGTVYNRLYIRSGGVWDAGVAIPSYMEFPQGVALVRSDISGLTIPLSERNAYVAGTGTPGTSTMARYRGGQWTRMRVPLNPPGIVATILGMDVDYTRRLWVVTGGSGRTIVGQIKDRLYRYDSGWQPVSL